MGLELGPGWSAPAGVSQAGSALGGPAAPGLRPKRAATSGRAHPATRARMLAAPCRAAVDAARSQTRPPAGAGPGACWHAPFPRAGQASPPSPQAREEAPTRKCGMACGPGGSFQLCIFARRVLIGAIRPNDCLAAGCFVADVVSHRVRRRLRQGRPPDGPAQDTSQKHVGCDRLGRFGAAPSTGEVRCQLGL
jgi:hypothetical protein